MQTQVYRLEGDPSRWKGALQEAVRWLKEDYPVAFPTETVYGLGANAFSSAAVGRIFSAKGRPSDNPLIVHIAQAEELASLVTEVPPVAQALMERFWPGPLTLILPAASRVAPEVTAGLPTVGVRMPRHPVALRLIQAAGFPLAAPSANLSGRPSPTRAEHVLQDLGARIPVILDGGETRVGVESTVVDCTASPPVILRPGGVPWEALRKVVPLMEAAPASQQQGGAPPSPGMKYTHYAPRGRLVLVSGEEEAVRERIRQEVARAVAEGRRVGILTTEEHQTDYPEGYVVPCGRRSDLASVARRLFDCLRRFDEAGIELIFAEAFPTDALGRALMNRLEKASERRLEV